MHRMRDRVLECVQPLRDPDVGPVLLPLTPFEIHPVLSLEISN